MKPAYLALLLGLVGSSAVAETPPLSGHAVYRVANDGGGLGNFIDDTVIFMEVPRDAPKFWVVERRGYETRVAKPRTFRHQWIDGRRCPAVARVLDSIGDLPATKIGAPANRDRTLTFDTTRVSLAGPMQAGEGSGTSVTISQEIGWLPSWWRNAQAALAPCWRNTPRAEGGGPDLPTLLFSDQDAREMKP